MSILVIAAHPDDETLGCGGTIAKLSAEGRDVHILILGEGITSRKGSRQETTEKIDQLRDNARKAARILGAKSVKLLSFKDNMFDTIPLLEIVQSIEEHISLIKPRSIFTHFEGDLNIDHSITFRALLTAARPLPKARVKHIFTFETLSATDWSFGKITASFEPNLFIDISPFLEKKIKAMEAYQGEIRPSPHPRSSHTIKTLAQHRGSSVGMDVCEAFSIVRTINMENIG